MPPGDSIILNRAELDLLLDSGFQAAAPDDLAAKLLHEAGQAGRSAYYTLSLVNIRQHLVDALNAFADQGGIDEQLADRTKGLAKKIEDLPAAGA